jgi:hypothetical protein
MLTAITPESLATADTSRSLLNCQQLFSCEYRNPNERRPGLCPAGRHANSVIHSKNTPNPVPKQLGGAAERKHAAVAGLFAQSLTRNGVGIINLLHVAPAKAGVQGNHHSLATLDSRFRGNDE